MSRSTSSHVPRLSVESVAVTVIYYGSKNLARPAMIREFFPS